MTQRVTPLHRDSANFAREGSEKCCSGEVGNGTGPDCKTSKGGFAIIHVQRVKEAASINAVGSAIGTPSLRVGGCDC